MLGHTGAQAGETHWGTCWGHSLGHMLGTHTGAHAGTHIANLGHMLGHMLGHTLGHTLGHMLIDLDSLACDIHRIKLCILAHVYLKWLSFPAVSDC